MEEDLCDKTQLEELVCKAMINKRLSKDQKIKIYQLLQDDIIKNYIPDNVYSKVDNKFTFDFTISLSYVSIETLIYILDVLGFNK